MARVSLFQRFILWAKLSLLAAFVGAISGAACGSGYDHNRGSTNGDGILAGLFIGAIGLALIPAAVAAWFLLLLMLRQASDAVKGSDE